MSQDKKYREFWNPGDDSTPGSYYIEIAALDELKAELEYQKFITNQAVKNFSELAVEKVNWSNTYVANLELMAALRDMAGALEHYKGSTLSDENGLHKEGTDALTRVARDCLAKHADLIGKLK